MKPFLAILLGENETERKCRFFLGTGILFLVSTLAAFAIYQINDIVLVQMRLDGLSPPSNDGVIPVALMNRVPSKALLGAVHRKRAEIIAFAEVIAILGLIYSYAVTRHILRQRLTQISGEVMTR